MKLQDVIVEVRDKNLSRLGIIQSKDLDLQYTGAFNNVGNWVLSLPYEHPMTAELRKAGSGIIVTNIKAPAPWDVMFSGPTLEPELAATPQDVGGTVTFKGVTDDVRLADAIALPTPANGDTYKDTSGHDVREGAAETVIHEYVSANIGPMYPNSGRSIPTLTLGPDLARGGNVKKSARYQVLGELIADIALLAGLGFRIVQRGDGLLFETYEAVDRRKTIRLDVHNSSLSGQRVKTSAPELTYAIVAGQGDLQDRQVQAITTEDAMLAEEDWGRRIERFIDQRQTNDTAEQSNAGEEALKKGGFTGVTIQAVPNEDSVMEYGTEWMMGDLVTVVVDNTEMETYVVGVIMKADSQGFRVGIQLGSEYALAGDQAAKEQRKLDQRISQLERNIGGGAIGGEIADFSIDPTKFNVASHFIY